jgi:peptide chain release factor subunit 1
MTVHESDAPKRATLADVRAVVSEANRKHLCLSVYLNCDANEVLDGSISTRLRRLLDNIPDDTESKDVRDTFRGLRAQVEQFVSELRPGTAAIAIFVDDSGWSEALWLPEQVEGLARFKTGPYVMPLIYMLDEWEQFCIALVEKDKAMLVLSGLATVEEVHRFEADDVPGRHKEGGEAAPRYERHILHHVDRHLDDVRDELVRLHSENRFRRLFLAGPVEARTHFKDKLPKHLLDILAEEVSLPAYISAADAVERVRPIAKEAERAEELQLVEEVVTRAEKGVDAVTGTDAALRAINRYTARRLLLDRETDAEAFVCEGSGILVGPADEAQPECLGPKRRVRLVDELPVHAMQTDIPMEIVQGKAAERLREYGGVAALLKGA